MSTAPPAPAVGRAPLRGSADVQKSRGRGVLADQDNAVREVLGLARRALSATGMERGRRRTRQDQISTEAMGPREIADLKIRTERRKPVSSAGPVFQKSELFFKRTNPGNNDPAV